MPVPPALGSCASGRAPINIDAAQVQRHTSTSPSTNLRETDARGHPHFGGDLGDEMQPHGLSDGVGPVIGTELRLGFLDVASDGLLTKSEMLRHLADAPAK